MQVPSLRVFNGIVGGLTCDIEIRIGYGVMDASEITKVGCQTLSNGLGPEVKLTFTDGTEAPAGPANISPSIPYRVHCATLPRHTATEVVIAIGEPGKPAPSLTAVGINGQYYGGFRLRRVATTLALGHHFATR